MNGTSYNYIYSKKFLGTLITFFCASVVFAQIPTNGLDVKHYSFTITLNDSNNIIRGNAEITTGFTHDENKVLFDLVNKNEDGKGMVVTTVTKNNIPIHFSQDAQHLIIHDTALAGTEKTYIINYEGVPADGLIISNNKYGHRAIFADNWPNRAHNWIPCNDHLSDKATVDFIVNAPDHYQVVSNGKKVEETNLPNHYKLTHWKEEVSLPTKIMVIGVADFAVNNVGSVDCIQVSSWVYPEDRDSGFLQYAIAKNILQWYIQRIGPYAYEKLANVQSKTIFGGMENAGCIFYFENSVGSKSLESLFAHEIAHQWFGDNATEKDWPHLWLSEGFATYMTDLYLENKYGTDTLQKILRKQRDDALVFYKSNKTPVVDTSGKNNLMHLLNANSYQKGAWVLHMLRKKLGDSLFWKGIRTYYKTYAGSNANTNDLEKVFEKVSHQNLKIFFNQWLFTAGQPMLNIEWKYNKAKKLLLLKIEQTQTHLFEFPLQIAYKDGNKTIIKTIEIKNKITLKNIPLTIGPKEIVADPGVNLFFVVETIHS
ncbi:MAG: M1 family metallopeptidase [Ginsengibacter sp.]